MTAPASTTTTLSTPGLSGRTIYLILSALFIAAFAARLGVRIALGEQAFWSQGYTSLYRLAERIAATGAFCDGDRCPRPPLYPGFLAATVLIGKNYLLVIIPQALIGAGTALLAFLIGREVADARAGLIACALAAFYPYYVVHDTALQDTALTTFFLALALCLTLRADRRGRIADWVVAGLACGATLLTRAALAPTIALLVIWIATASRAPVARDRLRGALATTIACFVLLSPWLLTTALHTGKAALSTDVGYELWVGNNPDTFSRFPQESIDASSAVAHSHFTPAEREALRASPGNPRAADGWYGERARDYILEHPLTTARNAVRKIAIAFSWRITPYRTGLAQWAYAASFLSVALFGIAGMAMTWRRNATWLVASLFVAFIGVTAVFSGQTSHRVYLDVYWMVFAGVALVAVIDRLSPRSATKP
ncbi:MAG: glycosyltransferase family 39 protein [Proteobacteria bacterium]|nr:glycosyltransferase family 39 protein [Pseudomonadota bacterium]